MRQTLPRGQEHVLIGRASPGPSCPQLSSLGKQVVSWLVIWVWLLLLCQHSNARCVVDTICAAILPIQRSAGLLLQHKAKLLRGYGSL